MNFRQYILPISGPFNKLETWDGVALKRAFRSLSRLAGVQRKWLALPSANRDGAAMELDHNGPELAESTGNPGDSDGATRLAERPVRSAKSYRKPLKRHDFSADDRWSRRTRHLFVIGASVALWAGLILLWSRRG